jgi:thioredoxin 1
MELTESNFKEEVLESDTPVFVLFWASWCTACKRMEVTVEELKEECKEVIKIRKVNVDRNPNLRFRYDIRGVPTYIIFNGGNIIERRIAAQSKEQLKKMIEGAIKLHRRLP